MRLFRRTRGLLFGASRRRTHVIPRRTPHRAWYCMLTPESLRTGFSIVNDRSVHFSHISPVQVPRPGLCRFFRVVSGYFASDHSTSTLRLPTKHPPRSGPSYTVGKAPPHRTTTGCGRTEHSGCSEETVCHGCALCTQRLLFDRYLSHCCHSLQLFINLIPP